jgi:hypothetical protein
MLCTEGQGVDGGARTVVRPWRGVSVVSAALVTTASSCPLVVAVGSQSTAVTCAHTNTTPLAQPLTHHKGFSSG